MQPAVDSLQRHGWWTDPGDLGYTDGSKHTRGHHHDHRTDHCRRTPEAGIIPALYSSTTCPPLSLDSGLIFQDCVAGTPCTLRNRGSITCTVPNQPELADVMTQEVHAAAVRAEL